MSQWPKDVYSTPKTSQWLHFRRCLGSFWNSNNGTAFPRRQSRKPLCHSHARHDSIHSLCNGMACDHCMGKATPSIYKRKTKLIRIIRPIRCFFAILTGLFWFLVAYTGIQYKLTNARRNMETKTFQMIEHSTRHWEPIFRGLEWNVTFEINDSTQRTDPTEMLKSYLVFEPVGGSLAAN
jgi:hypothetical protein